MSKKRFENSQEPSEIGEGPQDIQPAEPAPAVTTLSVGVMVGEIGAEDYCSSHYELNILRHNGLRRTMRRLYNGLVARDARMADGRRVTKGADVLRWVIEQIAKAAGEELPR